jgi:Tol biopolymer transport system component
MRKLAWCLLALALAGGLWLFLDHRRSPLPPEANGLLAYVSDRSGANALYLRRLPGGADRRLTFLTEAVDEPAFSPDGAKVAFSAEGRIGVVALGSGDVRMPTLGVDWSDASPAWRPDGAALLVVARRPGEANADIHLLTPVDAPAGQAQRRPLSLTPGLDESAPQFCPDGSCVVFVRQDSVFRLDLAERRTRRLTGGFRRMRQPRFLSSGRLLCLWTQEKQHGIDVMDADGRNLETIWQGSVYYSSVAPSPDGRFLAATYTFDLRFQPMEALRLRRVEELRLLDWRGNVVAALASSSLHANHSPDWAK